MGRTVSNTDKEEMQGMLIKKIFAYSCLSIFVIFREVAYRKGMLLKQYSLFAPSVTSQLKAILGFMEHDCKTAHIWLTKNVRL